MFVFGAISVVPQLDDLVKQGSEDFVGFFVSGHGTHGQDVRMARVVNAGLNDVIDGESIGGRQFVQIRVQRGRQNLQPSFGSVNQFGFSANVITFMKRPYLSHDVVMLLKVGHVLV